MSELISRCSGSTRSHYGIYTIPLEGHPLVTTNMAALYSSKFGNAITQSKLRCRPFSINITEGGATHLQWSEDDQIYLTSIYFDYTIQPVYWTDGNGKYDVHHFIFTFTRNNAYNSAMSEWNEKVSTRKYGLPKYGCILYEIELDYSQFDFFTRTEYTPVEWGICPNVYIWDPIDIPTGITYLSGDSSSIDLQSMFDTHFNKELATNDFRNSNHERIPPKVVISYDYENSPDSSITSKVSTFMNYLSEKGILSEYRQGQRWIKSCSRGSNIDYPTGPL